MKPPHADERLRPIVFTRLEAAALIVMSKKLQEIYGTFPANRWESVRAMVVAVNKVVAAINDEPEALMPDPDLDRDDWETSG